VPSIKFGERPVKCPGDEFDRYRALNYTMLHDDGQHSQDLDKAEVVLIGIRSIAIKWASQ
jgi:regulator of PEP synthase PpsR (kinase-PPPase family)